MNSSNKKYIPPEFVLVEVEFSEKCCLDTSAMGLIDDEFDWGKEFGPDNANDEWFDGLWD